MTRKRRWRWGALAAILVGVLGTGGWLLTHRTSAAADSEEFSGIPTTRITRAPLELSVHATGELRAVRSAMLPAPSVGGTLRILSLVATGTAVKTGDVIAELDPTEQIYALEQSRSELEEAEQQIVKRRADLDVQAAENEVALLTARFDVRRAELDNVMDRDLISASDFAKRQLALEEARRRLTQLESDTKSRVETNRAALALVEERRAKAQMATARAQQNIDNLVVKAPMDGLVVVRENRDASGGMFFSGMTLPEYRAGDNTFAGRPIADVFDLSGMALRVKVSEQDRANVAVGQAAVVVSDGLPGVELPATVSAVAGAVGASEWFEATGPVRQFDATLQLDRVDPRLRPGTTVSVVLKGKRVENVLQLPLQAVRQKAGKPIVFVQTPTGFESREVKLLYRTQIRAGIDGIDEGTLVALVDPTATPNTAGAAAPTGATGAIK